MSSIHSTLYLAHDSAETPYKIRLPPLVFTTTTTGMPFHDSQLGKHDDAPKETQIDNNALPVSLPPPYLEPQVCMNNTLGINTRPRSHRLSLSSIVSSSTCTTSSDEDSGASSTIATTPSVVDAITPSTTNPQAAPPSPDDPNAREPQFLVQCWSLPPQIAPKQCTIAPAPSSPALRPSSTPEPEPKTEDIDLDIPLSPDIVSQMLTTPVSSPEPTIENFVNKKSHIKRPKNAWIHFRCSFTKMIKSKDPTIRANEISKRAAIYWGKLTNKQKQPYHVLAEHSRLAHQEAFPNYRYRPKPSPKRRYTRRQILD